MTPKNKSNLSGDCWHYILNAFDQGIQMDQMLDAEVATLARARDRDAVGKLAERYSLMARRVVYRASVITTLLKRSLKRP